MPFSRSRSRRRRNERSRRSDGFDALRADFSGALASLKDAGRRHLHETLMFAYFTTLPFN
jgi:hypothetical protein